MDHLEHAQPEHHMEQRIDGLDRRKQRLVRRTRRKQLAHRVRNMAVPRSQRPTKHIQEDIARPDQPSANKQCMLDHPIHPRVAVISVREEEPPHPTQALRASQSLAPVAPDRSRLDPVVSRRFAGQATRARALRLTARTHLSTIEVRSLIPCQAAKE